MKVSVIFKNGRTGETKEVKVGWSWTCFLFSSFFGLPLFLRGLMMWGGIMAGFWVVNLWLMISAPELTFIPFCIQTGLGIYLGLKANELTAKHYLEKGWEIQNPDNDLVKMAKLRWGIAV